MQTPITLHCSLTDLEYDNRGWSLEIRWSHMKYLAGAVVTRRICRPEQWWTSTDKFDMPISPTLESRPKRPKSCTCMEGIYLPAGFNSNHANWKFPLEVKSPDVRRTRSSCICHLAVCTRNLPSVFVVCLDRQLGRCSKEGNCLSTFSHTDRYPYRINSTKKYGSEGVLIDLDRQWSRLLRSAVMAKPCNTHFSCAERFFEDEGHNTHTGSLRDHCPFNKFRGIFLCVDACNTTQTHTQL